MIYTFYSYKGGVGRSMAIANLGQWFAMQGLRVLMVDWDLEAPGLEEFFFDKREQVVAVRSQPGLLDLLVAYRRAHPTLKRRLAAAEDSPSQTLREAKSAVLRDTLPPLQDAIVQLPLAVKGNRGSLSLLSAGWRFGERFQAYAEAVQSFDWADFYASNDGEAYFDWMRESLRAQADLVLIDSRTGVTEMGGVCTRHLADAVVCLCAPNRQNLHGLVEMVQSFKRPELVQARGSNIDVVVVPTRVENSEITLLNQFAGDFVSRLDALTPRQLKEVRCDFWQLRIPYVPRYAYTETLAIGAADAAGDLVQAYKGLAASLLLLAPEETVDRAEPELRSAVHRWRSQLETAPPKRVLLCFGSADEQLALNLSAILRQNGLLVVSRDQGSNNALADFDLLLSQADVVIGVLTEQVLNSKFVLAELMTVRTKGVPLVMVSPQVSVSLLRQKAPAWVLRHPMFELGHDQEALIRALGADLRPLPVPRMAPSLLAGYVERIENQRLLEMLLGDAKRLALVGMAGVGKTSMAAWACRHPLTTERYFDGVLWAEVRQESDLAAQLATMYVALTGDRPAFLGLEDAIASLAEALHSRQCLVVLDEVVSPEALRVARYLGDSCAVLITTRDRRLAKEFAMERNGQVFELSDWSEADLGNLLQERLGGVKMSPPLIHALVARLGGSPLAAELAGRLLHERVDSGAREDQALESLVRALDAKGLAIFDRRSGSAALTTAIDATMELLHASERDRLVELAAFPEDAPIPLEEVRRVWALDEFDTENLLQRMRDLSIVELNLGKQNLRLHPMFRGVLRASTSNMDLLDRRVSSLLRKP